MGVSSGLGVSLGLENLLVLALIALHSTGGINQLLLAGKKGMALGTDIKLDFLGCTTSLEGITACAGDGNFIVFRMNFRFQFFLQLELIIKSQ